MKKAIIICLIALLIFTLTACSGSTTGASGQNGPPPPPGAGTQDSNEITENIESIIEDMISNLGQPPNDVVGFGAGYKREDPITPTENAALFKLFRSVSGTFGYYDMGCTPDITSDDMLTYDPTGENSGNTGYGKGNNVWTGKAGFNKYDRLGNLDSSIKKTEFDFVSIDKTTKRASTENAQALIDRASIYGYWIVSLSDDNILEGVVYDKGADDKLEPVKKGILKFKRVGPGPSEVNVEVTVNGNGEYKTEGELTAGHYEVSFDAKDGKGDKILNENWLYIPGDTPTKDWEVLVRNTYAIIYDFTHYSVSDGGGKMFEAHMEWHDIPIDWTVESEEAYELGRDASLLGMYCLTYEYFDKNPGDEESIDDNDDESETESTPGYSPSILNVDIPQTDGFPWKITQKPTLSFYRGAEDSLYLQDAVYMNLEYDIGMVAGDQIIEVPVEVDINPVPSEVEKQLEQQGWGRLSRIARLEEKEVRALIDEGSTIEILYEDSNPVSVRFKVTISPEK